MDAITVNDIQTEKAIFTYYTIVAILAVLEVCQSLSVRSIL